MIITIDSAVDSLPPISTMTVIVPPALLSTIQLLLLNFKTSLSSEQLDTGALITLVVVGLVAVTFPIANLILGVRHSAIALSWNYQGAWAFVELLPSVYLAFQELRTLQKSSEWKISPFATSYSSLLMCGIALMTWLLVWIGSNAYCKRAYNLVNWNDSCVLQLSQRLSQQKISSIIPWHYPTWVVSHIDSTYSVIFTNFRTARIFRSPVSDTLCRIYIVVRNITIKSHNVDVVNRYLADAALISWVLQCYSWTFIRVTTSQLNLEV